MNKLIITFSVIFSGLLYGETISFDENERIELIVNQTLQEQWPTLVWKSAPLIVTFENGHIFAFNLDSSDSRFEKILVGRVRVLFSNKDFWGVTPLHMQSHFEIEGQDAFVYKMTISDSPLHDVAILVHERFHRHQGEMFQMPKNQGSSVDHLSEENLTWIEIEDQLLRDFLGSAHDEKMDYLKDFIAVNQMRRESIDPLTKQWENGQLRMEGLADYVGTIALGKESLLLAMHPEETHENDFIDEAIKWRHYLAGAAMGYALDFLGVTNWQTKIEAGHDLADLLNQAMPLTRTEQEKRIKKVQMRLNYKKRRKIANAKVSKYLAKVDALETNYEKQEGIKLFLGHPPRGISGGGANDEMVYIDEGIVAINDSSVATTNDGHWKFETKNIPHLFQLSGGVREVKIGLNATVKIDKVSLDLPEILKEPREYPFTQLEIDCDTSSLNSKEHPGILVADSEGLYVQYVH